MFEGAPPCVARGTGHVEGSTVPLFDKVKSQAAQLAQAAQEAGKAGQSRLAEAQARKRADEMLRGLGRAVLASRTGRATDGTEVEIEQLLDLLTQHEELHGSLVEGGEEEEDRSEDHSGGIAGLNVADHGATGRPGPVAPAAPNPALGAEDN